MQVNETSRNNWKEIQLCGPTVRYSSSRLFSIQWNANYASKLYKAFMFYPENLCAFCKRMVAQNAAVSLACCLSALIRPLPKSPLFTYARVTAPDHTWTTLFLLPYGFNLVQMYSGKHFPSMNLKLWHNISKKCCSPKFQWSQISPQEEVCQKEHMPSACLHLRRR